MKKTILTENAYQTPVVTIYDNSLSMPLLAASPNNEQFDPDGSWDQPE